MASTDADALQRQKGLPAQLQPSLAAANQQVATANGTRFS